MEPGTGDKYLLYKQRIVFSLLRAAARVGVRLGMPLKQMALLQEMACFREARLTQGMKLDAIAELFDKSLRTVSSLNHQTQLLTTLPDTLSTTVLS